MRDSRTSIDAQFPILSERLRHDFTRIDEKIDKELNVADDATYLFTLHLLLVQNKVNEHLIITIPMTIEKCFMTNLLTTSMLRKICR